EEASQAAAQDARPAQEQEVGASQADLPRPSGRASPPGQPSGPGAVVSFLLRRLAGESDADPISGFDPEFNKVLLMPVARALYRNWFRVQMRGLEHVPASGPGLIVANHSGVLPIDAIMLQVGVLDEHP